MIVVVLRRDVYEGWSLSFSHMLSWQRRRQSGNYRKMRKWKDIGTC